MASHVERLLREVTSTTAVCNTTRAWEGNGRATRIWLDHMLRVELGKTVDWSLVSREDYLLAMERSPVRDTEIKALVASALSDRLEDVALLARGIDASYAYEGYAAFRAEEGATMAASVTAYKPNMAALEGRMGRSIYEAVRDAPAPDWKKLDEQSRVLEKKIVEVLTHAKS